MKKIWVFILGMVSGAVLLFLVLMVVGSARTTGINYFEEEGECISRNSFKVFQVLPFGDALATEIVNGIAVGKVALFPCENGEAFYDEQVISVPSGACVRQIGTYRYQTRENFEKTVPVVCLSKD